MALENVKLVDKDELTLPANEADFVYIKRQVAGGGFSATDYKINVRNLRGDALPYASDGLVPDPTEGTTYFNSTTKKFRGYDGAKWVDLSSVNNRASAKLSLSAADIKTLGSVPIQIVAAQGTGTYIKITSADGWLSWGSAAFDTNDLDIKTLGLTNPQVRINNLLDSTLDVNRSKLSYGASDMFLENTAVFVTGTDSVATGDSTIDLYITYEIITL